MKAILSPALALALFAGLAGTAHAQLPPAPGESGTKIQLESRPVASFDSRDPERREFGALVFRGGIELISTYQGFGGISAIRVDAKGEKFLAVSDRGRWLRGRIMYQAGTPKSVADAEMAPMLAWDGKPLALRGWFDTESLAEDGGTLYVGIERVNQIVKFDYGKDGLAALGEPIPVPPGIKSLPFNKGLEALAFVPREMPLGGTLIAISERGLDDKGNIRAFLIGGPTPGDFAFTRSQDFDITDAAVTPGQELLILERSFSLVRGPGMRIRRFSLAAIKPGAVLEGAVVFEADRNYQIDNMEGLAVHRTPEGETVLTLISDDNFNPLQRTLLLQFTLTR